MPETRIDNLLTKSDRLFEQVTPLRSRQQELAENFYPERADFTTIRSLGYDYAANLTTGYPITVRRNLANILSTILRPQDKNWAIMSTRNFESLDAAGKIYLEIGTKILRNAMYDPDSGFARTISQHDDDMVTFGSTVISCEMNWRKRALLFRNWHQRDVVWCETPDGNVGRVDRRWTPTAIELNTIFKGNVSAKVTAALAKEPYKTFEVRHMFVPVDEYDIGKKWHPATQYISVFYEMESKFLLEEKEYRYEYYVIPRWKTIAGSQYAYSPAAMTALPDARLIQDMFLVILEAGQKAVDPPLLSRDDLLRGDTNLFAGGITPTDSDYDERMGKPLTPVYDSRTSNIPIGVDLMERVQRALDQQFFLDKIGLPPMASGMSPLEVSERVNEYVRGALPLLEPLETESNAQVCALAFNVAFSNGFFGSTKNIPQSLQGKHIEFKFDNPLREASDKIKGQLLQQAGQVINILAPLDQRVPKLINGLDTARDTLEGLGVPQIWLNTNEKIDELVQADKQKQEEAQLMASLNQGADTALKTGQAMQAVNEAQK